MNKEVDRAIDLRKQGKLKESNRLLVKQVQENANDAFIHYQCAWSFDLLGEESKAAPFYEKSIELGLSGQDLARAILGLGSTYRTLGKYEKSKKVFSRGRELFPDNKAIQVFYSMTLYNLKEYSAAMELLLECLTETTVNEEILNYKKAINFYADKLDTVWK